MHEFTQISLQTVIKLMHRLGGNNMYCPYCGNVISENINFCPHCGAALKETSSVPVSASNAVKTEGKYSLILVSRGTCSAAVAGDLLEDIFGYTDSVANDLVSQAPVVVGQKMTAEEAAYVAQMFSEYGIQVSIQDENEEYVDLSSKAVKSVFDSNGNLLTNVLAVIGGLSMMNRVTTYRRVRKPSLLERLFMPLFTPVRPAVHRRYVRPKVPAREAMRTGFTPIVHYPNFGYRNASDHVRRTDNGRRGGPGGRPGSMRRGHR